jgi:hypothetical protein
MNDDTLRQRARHLLQPIANRCGDGPAISPREHKGGADNNLFAILGCRASPQIAADTHSGYIANCDRHPAARRHRCTADFVERANAPVRANEECFASALDEVCSY